MTGKPNGRQIIGRVRGEARAPVNGSRKKELALCGDEDITIPIWAVELRSTEVTEFPVQKALLPLGRWAGIDLQKYASQPAYLEVCISINRDV